MVGSTTGKPAGIKMVNRLAYATGGTGILANLFLIAFYALRASHPEDGTSLGWPTTWWNLSGPRSWSLWYSACSHGCPTDA
jgi:hypothetical protein